MQYIFFESTIFFKAELQVTPRKDFTVARKDSEQRPGTASISPWQLSQRGLCCADASGEAGAHSSWV